MFYALYSDDAVFEVVGKLTLQGRNSIRNLTQYDSVLHIHMTLSNIEMNSDTVSCHLAETND